MGCTCTRRRKRWAAAGRRCSTTCCRARPSISSIFNYPTLTWADIGAVGWLVDGAAIMNQIPLCRCSYGPYARAMIRVCKEESFHQRQGFEIMMTLCRGTPEQKAMAQDALDRWYWPCLMMFGPPDGDSTHSDQSTALEDQALLATTSCGRSSWTRSVPQAQHLGLTLPDPALRFEPTGELDAKGQPAGHWQHGPIDWEEFRQVLSGNGPCNRERMPGPPEVACRGRLGARRRRGLCRQAGAAEAGGIRGAR